MTARCVLASRLGAPCVGLAATVLAWSPASAGAAGLAGGRSPSSTKCPSAALVGSTLGLKVGAPVTSVTAFSKTCTYRGSGPLSTKITFQKDTAATFAAGEKSAAAGVGIVKIHGLGQAAWAPRTGGFLYVFDRGESIKILAPLTSTAKLEALARKLL